MLWVLFVVGAVVSWGMYGAMLHQGQVRLQNPMKALLCVGAAYFLVGVLVPVATLYSQGALGGFNSSGTAIAVVAGALGAAGAGSAAGAAGCDSAGASAGVSEAGASGAGVGSGSAGAAGASGAGASAGASSAGAASVSVVVVVSSVDAAAGASVDSTASTSASPAPAEKAAPAKKSVAKTRLEANRLRRPAFFGVVSAGATGSCTSACGSGADVSASANAAARLRPRATSSRPTRATRRRRVTAPLCE